MGSERAPTAPPPSPTGNRPQVPKRPGPAAGLWGPDAQRPETRLGAPRPTLEVHGGPRRAPPLRPTGLGPPTTRSAHTGGPATWRPGCAPLAGPSGARPARLGERPPTRGSGLTQKTKLKTKSRYLMHLVQPSTPMAARAAGGLRGAGRSWAAGAGPGRLIGSRWPGGRLGRADGGQEGRWRPGREARLCLCHRCALAFWPGARPTPSLIGRRGHAPEAPPPTLPPERGEAAAAAPSPAPGGRDARPFPPRSHTSGCQTWCSQDPGAWAQSARRGTRPWAAGALGFP